MPSTPSGKLALPDLIEMGDVKRTVQNISPDERVLWNDGKDGMLPTITPLTTGARPRKRARSSSPISSSPAQTSNQFISKADLLNQQVDPGSELWGRYSLNGSKASTPSTLVHILHASSPQPAKENIAQRPTSGFRRAISCGNQFPKRRKTAEFQSSLGDDLFSESSTSRPSRLSVLIERVQEGFSQSKFPANFSQELSSSPVTKGDQSLSPGQATSPTPNRGTIQTSFDKTIPTSKQDVTKNNDTTSVHRAPVKSTDLDYDEFDDDELDASLLDTFVTGSDEMVFEHTPRVIVSSGDKKLLDSNARKEETEHHMQPVSTKPNGDFEFDDLDEEMLSADLENIIARFDKQDDTKIAGTSRDSEHNQTFKTDEKEESVDEYGDGLEDLDFEAVDTTEPNPLQESTGGLLPVRTVLNSKIESTSC